MARCGYGARCAQARPRCRFVFPASPRPTSMTCTSVGSSAGACVHCSSHSDHSFRRSRPAGSGRHWSESPACSPRSANWMSWPRCRPCKPGKAAASWLRSASVPSSDSSAGWQVRQIGRRSSCVPAVRAGTTWVCGPGSPMPMSCDERGARGAGPKPCWSRVRTTNGNCTSSVFT